MISTYTAPTCRTEVTLWWEAGRVRYWALADIPLEPLNVGGFGPHVTHERLA